MLQKYSRICPVQPVASDVCCPRVYRPPLYDPMGEPYQRKEAVPESIRVRAQLCTPYVRPGRSSATCIPGGEESVGATGPTGPTGTIGGFGTPGTDAPIETRTVSASEYTALVGAQVLNASVNATNPDTRFQQYFPESIPAPERVVCPERIPNPVTVRDRGCVPQAIFAPSVPNP